MRTKAIHLSTVFSLTVFSAVTAFCTTTVSPGQMELTPSWANGPIGYSNISGCATELMLDATADIWWESNGPYLMAVGYGPLSAKLSPEPTDRIDVSMTITLNTASGANTVEDMGSAMGHTFTYNSWAMTGGYGSDDACATYIYVGGVRMVQYKIYPHVAFSAWIHSMNPLGTADMQSTLIHFWTTSDWMQDNS